MPVSKGMFALSIGFTSSMTNLKERRALVTGGSRGIGAEIVRRLAADGAAVAFTYGSSAADAEKLVAEVAADGGDGGRDPGRQRRPRDRSRNPSTKPRRRWAGWTSWSTTQAWPTRRRRVVPAGAVRTTGGDQRARRVRRLPDARSPISARAAASSTSAASTPTGCPGPGLSVYAMTKGAVAGIHPWTGP